MCYVTFSCGFLEEEHVCISVCTKSVTRWQLLLLSANLNLEQKSASLDQCQERVPSDCVCCTAWLLMGPEATVSGGTI